MDRILFTLDNQKLYGGWWKTLKVTGQPDEVEVTLQLNDRSYVIPHRLMNTIQAQEVILRFLILVNPKWDHILPKVGAIDYDKKSGLITVTYNSTQQAFFFQTNPTSPRPMIAEYETWYLMYLTFFGPHKATGQAI